VATPMLGIILNENTLIWPVLGLNGNNFFRNFFATFYCLNLARKQKSLATPAIE
jgi:hypothetical protein